MTFHIIFRAFIKKGRAVAAAAAAAAGSEEFELLIGQFDVLLIGELH